MDYPDLLGLIESTAGAKSIWCTTSLEFETRLTRRKGVILGGAWSPQFIRESEQTWAVPFVRLLDRRPKVLFTEAVGGNFMDWLPMLEALNKAGQSLLVVTERIHEPVLRCFIVNSVSGAVDICVVHLNQRIADRSIIFGKPLYGPPSDIGVLPAISEAWIRKDSTLVLLDSPDDFRSVAEEVFIIEVGGDDFEDQQARLRYASDIIRRRGKVE